MSRRKRDDYLRRLRRELQTRWIPHRRILEETSAHLDDATNAKLQDGLSLADAEAGALAAFGAPDAVARDFADGRERVRLRALLPTAVALGLTIAYVDSRPGWDAAGITAFAMLSSAALLGLVAPKHVWLLALTVGIWIPLAALLHGPSPAHLAMLLILVFPFAGAGAGAVLSRILRAPAA